MSRPPKSDNPLELTARALGDVAGPNLVLDSALRVVASSPAAQALLGFSVKVGESAPRLLCGKAQ